MKRIVYRGTLRFPHGFHSGEGRHTALCDQPLARTAGGRIELSGTSLTGVLRADLRCLNQGNTSGDDCSEQPTCQCTVCELLGPMATEERNRTDAGLRASRLHVRGGVATVDPAVRIRDRVAIDRRSATAAEHRKYDVEVAEDVEFPFELRIDSPSEAEQNLLEGFLHRLAEGWLAFGGKVSSGLGRARICRLDRHVINLGNPSSLVESLLADDSTAAGFTTPMVDSTGQWQGNWSLTSGNPMGDIRLGVALHFPFGVLVDDPVESLLGGVNHAFMRLADGRPLLPGSSLRGALRQRAERILRTLGRQEWVACDLNSQGSACHERIQQEVDRRGEPLQFEEELDTHCAACRIFGSGRVKSAVAVTDFLPLERPTDFPEGLHHEFVAIDRFTGGAADAAKFNAKASSPVTLRGEIYLRIGPDRLQDWGLGLMSLLIRDLLLGDLPIGFGSAKGLNEYSAVLTHIDRFWTTLPTPFDGCASVNTGGSGPMNWRPSGDLGFPAETTEVIPPDLADRLRDWVQALHHHLAPTLGETP